MGVASYEVQKKLAAAADWDAAVNVGNVAEYRETVSPGEYNVRIRAVSDEGIRGPWSAIATAQSDENVLIFVIDNLEFGAGNVLVFTP